MKGLFRPAFLQLCVSAILLLTAASLPATVIHYRVVDASLNNYETQIAVTVFDSLPKEYDKYAYWVLHCPVSPETMTDYQLSDSWRPGVFVAWRYVVLILWVLCLGIVAQFLKTAQLRGVEWVVFVLLILGLIAASVATNPGTAACGESLTYSAVAFWPYWPTILLLASTIIWFYTATYRQRQVVQP
jgi:hypothetical protein